MYTFNSLSDRQCQLSYTDITRDIANSDWEPGPGFKKAGFSFDFKKPL